MAREIKFGRIIVWLVLLPVLLFFVFKWLFFSVSDKVILPFQKKEFIAHEVRLFVKPHSFYHDGHLDIELTIESNERPEFVRQDPMQTCLIYVDGDDTPLLPESFNVSQKDAYHVTGLLTFKVPSYPKEIKFILFDEVQYEFVWKVSR